MPISLTALALCFIRGLCSNLLSESSILPVAAAEIL
jgi:hypothetical protein